MTGESGTANDSSTYTPTPHVKIVEAMMQGGENEPAEGLFDVESSGGKTKIEQVITVSSRIREWRHEKIVLCKSPISDHHPIDSQPPLSVPPDLPQQP